jgi:hypothetical protein
MAEILLDNAIAWWVFLPLFLITLLFGIARHYVSLLISSDKAVELQQTTDSHAVTRARLLRENGRYLPKQAFLIRKYYFNDKDNGFFKKQNRHAEQTMKSPFDQLAMGEMVKGNLLQVVPMLAIGSWINYAFAGFLCAKLPFPLTFRFKPMLQRGMESLVSLDPSWVSSASWYFLNCFGLRGVYSLVLGAGNSADQMGGSLALHDQFIAPAAQFQPSDAEKVFKAEWEAMELVEHHPVLTPGEPERDLLAQFGYK